MRRGPTHITKDHLRLQKKMSSIHIFKIAEGRETGGGRGALISLSEAMKIQREKCKG